MRSKLRIKVSSGRYQQVTIPQALEYAVKLHRSGEPEQAKSVYGEVLRYQPTNNEELQALGAACYHFGNFEEALRHFSKVLARAPRNPALQSNLGATLIKLGRLNEALETLQTALSLDPNHAESHSNLGDLLTDMQRYEEALIHCRRAAEIDSRSAPAHNNLGRVLERLGRPEEAKAAYELALKADPNLSAANYNLGALLHRNGHLQEPLSLFARSACASPEFAEAHFNQALYLLRQGDFARGFDEYEWRWRCKAFPSASRNFQQPLWDGSDLSGKTILLHAEQGLGDTIQFVRFIPQVAARNGRIIVEVQPELKSLLADFPGINQLLAKGEDLPPFDCHCPLLSLPRALGTRIDTIPANIPYFKPDRERVAAWKTLRRPNALHVGLVWVGGATHPNDHNRSIPLAAFAPLMSVEGMAWFSLQKGKTAGQAASSPSGMVLQDLSPHLRDFSDTAAILSNLDLLVTVDTAVAHLGGALGLPVWILVPYTPDWRWLMHREDSPWYPTMRLFRQSAPGDWEGVMERVRAALPLLVEGVRRGNQAERRRNVVATKETDLERWSDAAQLETGWDRRAALAADFIPAGSTVLDLGCGAMALERFLPPGCHYVPCDVVRRDERTILCDFNKQEVPAKGGASIVSLLGVLEYIYDWKSFLRQLRTYEMPVIMSYCLADYTGAFDRSGLGWVNHVDLKELTETLTDVGFSVQSAQRIDEIQVIFRLSPHPPLARLSRKVLVLSYKNVGNFGDRLGFHLINSVLPAQASVTWAHFNPWDVPDEDFDLAIIGIGNSIFRPLLCDELLALVERVPRSIGIFGTQYRESLDPQKLNRLLDRLTTWFARYEEDLLLYGRNRQNVVHMGDWLIGQFGMSEWTINDRLTVDQRIWDDTPLDRTIQTIQQYREVFSQRVHPLLCALTSAERVAYREQRGDGTPHGRSGKFRSMLLDVFGRTFPEETFFDVNRDAVASYRGRVQASVGQLPGVLSSLLGLQASDQSGHKQ